MTAIIQKTIALADVIESATNPRKHFDDTDLAELAASIKEKGVLQPVLVRQIIMGSLTQHYELVAGARRYRASKLAGVNDIPAVIREMTDAEVLEVQVIENNQRKDVHPLEEADGFSMLTRKYGHTAETIAARIGRSTSYVTQRLKLTELCDDARKAFLDGDLNAAAALVLARVPSASLQKEVLADVRLNGFGEEGEPFTAGALREIIRRDFSLRLADAPFDVNDALLVAAAGACASCPKRTGNQAELFADLAKEDLCTDPKCHAQKCDAEWKRRSSSPDARTLSPAETKKVIQGGQYGSALKYDAPFVSLAGEDYDPKTGKRATWKKLLGKEAPPVVLARGEDGKIYELVDRAAAEKVLKAKHPNAKTTATGLDDDYKKRAEKHRFEAAIAAEGKRRSIVELVAVIERDGIKGPKGWRAVVAGLLSEVWEDHRKTVAKRRALLEKGERAGEALEAAAEKMNERELTGLAVELLCVRDGQYSSHANPLDLLCQAYGIDREAHEKAVTLELRAKKKEKAKKKVVTTKKAGSRAKARVAHG